MIRCLSLLAIAGALLLSFTPAVGSAPALLRAHVALPYSNVDWSGPVVSDSRVVYSVADPPTHPPVCVSCGDPPFTAFHNRFYVADVKRTGITLTISTPRLLFTEAQGVDDALYSDLGGWLVYLRYHSTNAGQGWELHARNIASGKDVVLDSPQIEGLPSMPQGASSDGHTVAWVSWTQGPGGGTCLIRTYNLSTGRVRIVARGGSPNSWAWKYASISGNRIAVQHDDYIHNRSRIDLLDLSTGRWTRLTDGTTYQSEPFISGNLVVWKNAASGDQGKGVWVDNLKTGKRLLLHGFDTESPHAFDGRYVAFPFSKRANDRYEAIRLYDTLTGQDRVVFAPSHGWGVGNWMTTGEHTLGFQNGRAGTPVPRERLSLIRVP